MKTINCICICHCGAETESIQSAIHTLMQEFSTIISRFDILHITPNQPKDKIDKFKVDRKVVDKAQLTEQEAKEAKPYWAAQATIEKLKTISKLYPAVILLASRQVREEIEKLGLAANFFTIESIFIPNSDSIEYHLKNILRIL